MTDENILFLVNPHSAGKRTGKTWDKIYNQISDDLSHQSSFKICDGIGTGKTASIDAVKSGDYTMIVSVGGEGTANEVVNGIMECEADIKLGFIRGGTVNDYLHVIGWPNDLTGQINLLNRAITRKTPVTKAIGDETRYSLNIADAGVSANVSYMASIQRKLTWIRGGLRYTLLALRAISQWSNIPATVRTDNREISSDLSILMAGFSTQSGDYKITYQADPFGDKMAYTYGMNFSKRKMLGLMGTLRKGEHTEEIEGVYMGHTSSLIIDADRAVLFEVDGEPFSYESSKIELKAIPAAINVIDPTIE